MSDLTLFSKDKLPAYLKTIEFDASSKSLIGSGSPPRISLKGNVFRKFVNGQEVMCNEDRAMNVIILRTAPVEYRTYYEGTYKEGETKGPSCWSSDGVSPDSGVKNPQASKCAECPQNIKGSGQGDGRACQFKRWAAVALENDLDGDVMQLIFPAQSVFGKGEKGKLPLRQYAKFLAGYNLPITAVVTEMRFDISSATPKLTFKPVRPLTEEEYAKCRELAERPDAIECVTMNFISRDDEGSDAPEADDESVAVLKAAAAKLGSKAKVEADDDEEPPKVRGKRKDEEVTSVLDQWASDDDDDN